MEFFIGLIIIAVLAFLFVVLRIWMRNRVLNAEWGEGQTFVCPNCGHEFFVSAGKMSMSYVNLSDSVNRNKRALKCPACGKRDLCVMRDHRV